MSLLPRIRPRRLAALLALPPLVIAGVLAAPPGTHRAAAAIGGLTWADDFNGPAGTPPDPAKWTHDTGGGGFGNNELEFYTNSTNNAALDGNGNLVMTARRETVPGSSCWYGTCQYSSARLNTAAHFTQTFGRLETRMRIPRGQGMWPAFWALGSNIGSVGWPTSGEIDVMENIGREPSTVHGTLHGPGYSGGNGLGAPFSLSGGAFADAFHTFSVDWGPDSVTFAVDGTVYERRTPADTRGNPWVFNHPFFLLMDLAVGGGFPGNPDGSTSFPQQLVVDYVHVFAWTDSGGGGGTGQVTGLGGKCLDVSGANTANGTPVQLWTCNGTGAQSWTVGTDHDVVNPQANKCLDATGSSSADGTRAQIWTCSGAANQKWTTP